MEPERGWCEPLSVLTGDPLLACGVCGGRGSPVLRCLYPDSLLVSRDLEDWWVWEVSPSVWVASKVCRETTFCCFYRPC